jgi:hypothetical protein
LPDSEPLARHAEEQDSATTEGPKARPRKSSDEWSRKAGMSDRQKSRRQKAERRKQELGGWWLLDAIQNPESKI